MGEAGIASKAGIARSADSPVFWKAIGLILTDSILSHIVRGKNSVYFRGMNKETMLAVLETFRPIFGQVKPVSKEGYFTVILSINTVGRDRVNCLKELVGLVRTIITKPYVLEKIGREEKAAFLAGLIDGDGYIGKKGGYMAISYKADTYKGRVVGHFLSLLSRDGSIKLGKYRGRPHYEHTFTFMDHSFLSEVVRYTFVPHKHRRLKEMLANILKMRQCSLNVDELYKLLKLAKTVYVDYRKDRGSRVLIIYLDLRQKRLPR